MEVKILHDGAVSPNLANHSRGIACVFPLPCQLGSGDLLCVYRQGKEKHSHDGILMVQKSSDNGLTWSEQIIVYDGIGKENPESVHTGAVCQVNDGTILAVFTTVEAIKPDVYVFSEEGKRLRQQLYISRSKDGGTTWSSPEQYSLTGAPHNTYIGGRPFLLPTRDLFIPFEGIDEFGHEILLAAISSDGGLTLSPLITCAFDRKNILGHGDSKYTVLPNGHIIMLTWTWVYATEQTQAVHRCVSTDNGRTWSTPVSTNVISQIMAPLALDSSRLIAASNVRDLPAPGIYLWFSTDAGKTWALDAPVQMWDSTEEKMKGIPLNGKHVSLENTSEGIWDSLPTFTFGMPDLLRLEENLFLLIYYATINNILHVRACQFKTNYYTLAEARSQAEILAKTIGTINDKNAGKKVE